MALERFDDHILRHLVHQLDTVRSIQDKGQAAIGLFIQPHKVDQPHSIKAGRQSCWQTIGRNDLDVLRYPGCVDPAEKASEAPGEHRADGDAFAVPEREVCSAFERMT